MSYDDVEAELNRHPKVRECLVTKIPTGPRKNMLVAYIAMGSGRIDADEVRAFLSAPRMRSSRIPKVVIPVADLPRTPSGEVDREALPLPVIPGLAAGGKGSSGPPTSAELVGFMVLVAGFAAFLAFLTTDLFWPHSTDLSAVPQPWARLFKGLYAAEDISFGLGISFLFFGRGRLADQERPRWLASPTCRSSGCWPRGGRRTTSTGSPRRPTGAVRPPSSTGSTSL
jgi:hypothetical protein